MVDLSLQNFVVARLLEFCDYKRPLDPERVRDPIGYLWEKLGETEEPLTKLKQQLLQDAVGDFLKKTTVNADELTDFKQLLDGYLAPGDFADAAFMLEEEALKDPERRKPIATFLKEAKAHSLLEEDKKPEAKRGRNCKRIVGEIYERLGYPLVEKVLGHKKLNAHKLRFVLRRCRFNSAEFCTVFRFPKGPGDTFTPFILPRVEGLIAANRRIFQKLRAR
ncbi:MAG: hypothetical protein V3S11_04820 [Elusimicrobiota bacterium]